MTNTIRASLLVAALTAQLACSKQDAAAPSDTDKPAFPAEAEPFVAYAARELHRTPEEIREQLIHGAEVCRKDIREYVVHVRTLSKKTYDPKFAIDATPSLCVAAQSR
jgi:hypothetical protein